MKNSFSATNPNERIEQIDILRGFALLGVLLVNALGYNASFFDFGGFYSTFTDPLNSSVYHFITNYGADKFIGLFSFLFGVSFSIMYLKNRYSETEFATFYVRRLLVLMIFGIIHITFFWAGDILFTYSLMGIILLSSRKLPSRLLLFMSIFTYFLPIIYIALNVSFPSLPDALSSTSSITMPEVLDTYANGAYIDVFKLRLHEYFSFRYINLIYYVPKIISLFLFGYLFHKHQFFEKIKQSKNRYLILSIILLFVGIVLNTYTLEIAARLVNMETSPYATAIYMLIFEVTNVVLILSYILIILTLTKNKFFRYMLNPLKYIGRMTLTNYLMYSIIFTTIMYAYGFGQFGSFEPWQLLIFSILFFIVQIAVCKTWLQHFRFGPFEWLWRRFTYPKRT
ncbi:MAG: hypothetical protein CSA04_00700 [Bacteroidetes bacterium]|nr:MAG: hypothetical protein CSA04_00700 [Bacteroidota bacterium]